MSYKRFKQKDIVLNTIVAKPEFNFIIHSGSVFLQRERSVDGNYSNKIKHVPSGHVSLYELNVDRPADSLIYSFIEKSSTRYSFRTITNQAFDSEEQFAHGDQMKMNYPLSASVSRIYVPAGAEISSSSGGAHGNKKYIRALRNPITSANVLGSLNKYGNLGTTAANLICVPGIFAGSEISKGSIELNYYVTGTLVATAKDLTSDGRLIQTYGTAAGSEVGFVVYNQGILILTGSESLHSSTDNFFSTSESSNPSWLSFGTGMPQVGVSVSHTGVEDSSYSITFKGTNKIPSLTMFAFSEKGEHNLSKNPTFLSKSSEDAFSQNEMAYRETQQKIKKINKSPYSTHEEDFKNTTYISKVGIYDKDKNLIAVASLANPVKKTENRDFMFKLKLDL
jgi:hypothetical protein